MIAIFNSIYKSYTPQQSCRCCFSSFFFFKNSARGHVKLRGRGGSNTHPSDVDSPRSTTVRFASDYLSFQSNVHKSPTMQIDWAKKLEGNDWVAPYNTLERMYNAGDPSYQITIWYLSSRVSLGNLYQGTLAPLSIAVEDHTPPFHQYLD